MNSSLIYNGGATIPNDLLVNNKNSVNYGFFKHEPRSLRGYCIWMIHRPAKRQCEPRQPPTFRVLHSCVCVYCAKFALYMIYTRTIRTRRDYRAFGFSGSIVLRAAFLHRRFLSTRVCFFKANLNLKVQRIKSIDHRESRRSKIRASIFWMKSPIKKLFADVFIFIRLYAI